jgi:enoyl-CoA hydratase/carnithine racemase
MKLTTYDAKSLLIEIKEDYAIVQLNNGKVNAINPQLLVDL